MEDMIHQLNTINETLKKILNTVQQQGADRAQNFGIMDKNITTKFDELKEELKKLQNQ